MTKADIAFVLVAIFLGVPIVFAVLVRALRRLAHPWLSPSLEAGERSFNSGQWAEAEKHLRRALEEMERLPADDPHRLEAMDLLGRSLRVQGKLDDAEAILKECLTLRQVSLAPDDLDLAISLNSLGAVYQDRGLYSEAEPLLRRSLDIRERTVGPNYPSCAFTRRDLAAVLRRQGKYEEAEALLRKSLEAKEQGLGPHHPQVAGALYDLANYYQLQGQETEAEALRQRASAIEDHAFGKSANRAEPSMEQPRLT
jgi:tetratricopeptide (TPR) repeat protein